ncbi:TonB-dependent siderophore receptor [Aureimonas mangrovi]|uniref:TonB-dependent siderophore receptor n=1 Tax=Aureimonas mangrovi TaxID=2758041 RepID=UPI00163DD34B|nr:TonB-dependent siderophore receptor [Aureimonas mangrovi]
MPAPSSATRRFTRWSALTTSLVALCAGAPAVAQQTIQLDTVVVEGQGGTGGTPGEGGGGGLTSGGYVARATTTGTKTDTDIRKVPQSIGTVSREELEDRQVQSVVDAARYTAGVRAGQFGFDPAFDTLYIRGFDVSYIGNYRDGLRNLGGSFSTFRHEPYGLQGITILKGPSSVLYGAGSPGGLVNVISKRPTEEAFREVETQIGSHDRYQGALDLSGPIGQNDNVLYRLTGLWRSADTEFVAARNDRFYVAPALTFRSDDRNTHLTVLGEYSDLKSGGGRGFYTTPEGDITGIEQGDPAFRDLDNEQWRIGYEFEHRFSDQLAVRQNLRYQNVDTNMRFVSVTGISDDGLTGFRTAGQILDDSRALTIDNQIEGRFATGPVAHTVLGGLDYAYLDSTYRYGGVEAPPLDLVTRNYGRQPIDGPSSHDDASTATELRQIGLYLQDQIEYNRFVLTAGGRYDWAENRSDNFVFPDSSSDQDDEEFTGRIGLAYLFDNGIAPYVSYSTSFTPTVGVNTTTGEAFVPTTGEMQEIGVRYMPTDLNLSMSAALFRITQSNTTQTLGDNTTVQTGERRSQGLELSATAGLTDGLSLTAAYTFLDMEIREEANFGNVPASTPEHQFSIWGDYEFLSGPAQGLGLGLGVRFIGETYETDANLDKNSARALVDAAISYDFSHLGGNFEGVSAQLNATNIFDDREALCNNGYCYREEGRNVIGSLRYRF